MKIYYNLAQLYRIVLGFIKPRVHLTDEVFANFIVWPWLTEFWRVLQASEFTQFTDAGRWELAVRTGYLQSLLRKRAWGVVGGQKIIYRRPIPVFSHVKVSMQIMGWENEWLYIVHRFFVKKRLHALSFVRLAIRNKNGAFQVKDLVEEKHPSNTSELPQEIRRLFESDSELLARFESLR